MRAHIATLQSKNSKKRRIWLEGNWLAKYGFETGTSIKIESDSEHKMLTCRPVDLSDRAVSGRKKPNGATRPIIEFTAARDLEHFEGMDCIRVICDMNLLRLIPIASETRRIEALSDLKGKILAGDPIQTGSVFHGGGVLSETLHEGLQEGGVKSESAVIVELREEMLDISSQNSKFSTDKTMEIVMPAQEVMFDEWLMRRFPRLAMLSIGIPCSGASPSGATKNKISMAESHPMVGHMVVPSLVLAGKMAPPVIVIECVPQYLKTASMEIIRSQLRDMGYILHETLIAGGEWGSIEDRERMCAVAVMKGIEIDWEKFKPPSDLVPQKIGDILEPIADDDPRWKTMQGLKEKEARDIAAKKGFKMAIFDAEDTAVGTIGKGYAKVRSTEPKLRHPTNPDLLRQFTPLEHGRLKSISPTYFEGDHSDTLLHEMLGQSIVTNGFKALAKLIAEALIRFAHGSEILAAGILPAGLDETACG